MPRKNFESWFKGISKAQVTEWKRKAATGETLQMEKNLQPFISNLSNKIMTQLAYLPYENWPEMCKDAFKYARREMPAAAQEYRLNQAKVLSRKGGHKKV